MHQFARIIAYSCIFFLSLLFGTENLYAQEQIASANDQFPAQMMILIGAIFFIGATLLASVLFAGALKRFHSFSRDAAIIAGWNSARERWRFFVGVILLQRTVSFAPFFLTLVAVIVLRQSYDTYTVQIFGEQYNVFTALSNIFDVLLSAFFMIGLLRIAFNLLDKMDIRVQQLFSGASLFPRFILSGTLYVLCGVVGFVLFVIPGIYLAVALSLWPQYIVDRNAGPVQALKMSWRATKGARGELFLFYVLVLAINIGGLLVFLVGTFLTIPMTLVALNHVYRQLSQRVVSSQAA